MRRALLVLLGILFASCMPKGWTGIDPAAPEQSPFPVDIGPYLVRFDPKRVAVVVGHSTQEPPLVEHWIAASSSTAPAEPARYTIAERDHGLWVAVLDQLPADREIRYRVRVGETTIGPLAFKSSISRGKKVRFVVFGDTRTGHQIHAELIRNIAKENLDFAINSGDLVEFGGVDEQWRIYFQIEAPLISRTMLLPVIGNHDDAPRGLFERYFLLERWTRGHRYYHQDWGNLRVVVLDTQIELRRGSKQYAFAERALREGARANQLLLLAMHYPPYSSGQHGSNFEIRDVVADLAIRFGVELVVAGHDHDYERTKPIDGTTYIVAASSGATIRRVTPSEFTAEMRTEPHYVVFDVEQGGLIGRAINLSGNTFDNFVIPPNPPREVE